ncbi:MAG: MAPEG family protein [Pseudomonadota bacterium]
MTTELFWLTLTMGLAASLWIPFVVRVNTPQAGEAIDNGLPIHGAMPRAAQLANRAHINLIEQGMPFAALVIMAHVLGVSSVATVAAAIAFFWLRVAHAAVMLWVDRQIPLRPIIFTAGWLCSLVFVVEILRLA